MTSSFFTFIYLGVLLLLLWQAFRVMGKGFFADRGTRSQFSNGPSSQDDRTGRRTIHPELLDEEGRITEEELLTVRFSGDIDPPKSAETSAE